MPPSAAPNPRTLTDSLTHVVQFALNFLLPQHCVLCRQPVPSEHATASGRPRRLCHWCMDVLPGLGMLRCDWCGLAVGGTAGIAATPRRCPACRSNRPGLGCRTLVLGDYAAPLSDLVRRLKYHHETDLGQALVQVHGDTLLNQLSPGALPLPAWPDVVMPLPLTPSRLRSRGYNQAGILAHAYSRLLNRPLDQRSLRRRDSHHPSQVGRSRRERLQAVVGSFEVSRLLSAQHVLLVDDVMTTGATLNAAGDALLAAGASAVTRVVIARTA